MHWDIRPNNCIFSDCFDSLVAAVTEYYSYDSILLKLGCFSPQFISIDKLQEKFLHDKINRGVSIYGTAQELYGMRIEYLSFDSENIHKIINKELSENIISVEMDPYYCEWSDFYQKSHWMHDIIIVDILKSQKMYQCVDIYYPTNKYIYISFSKMEELCDELFIIHINKKVTPSIKEIASYMKRYIYISPIDSYVQENILIQLFIKDLKNENLGEVQNLRSSILLIKLTWIAEDKINFLEGLKYLEDLYDLKGIFSEMYKPLDILVNKIIILKNNIIKFSISGQIPHVFVECLLKDIIQLNDICLETLKKSVLTLINSTEKG